MDLDLNTRTRLDEAALIDALKAIAGDEAVLTSLEQRTFYATDIASRGETPAAVVRVGDVETLSKVVRAATERGHGVTPRGGGFSYTGGYTPSEPSAVIVDLRGLDKVVEVNLEDMYVVVEAGCTWRALYEALKAKGVRTPYFGPMSGYRATVGGALSQGSLFLGSTQYGLVSDSVLALEVVLADGSVVRTGSWGSSDDVPPFLRQYGPDLTGLFLSDTGAMGFKTRAALKLIPFPEHRAYGSFAFTNHAAALKALSAIGRTTLASECYCWDPYFVRLMANASSGLKQDIGFLKAIVREEGLGAAAQVALAGRGAFKGDTWLLHVTFDDASAAGAESRLRQVRRLARAEGGRDAAPSAPRLMRATPFIDFNTPERRTAPRNLPVHGLAPHSRAGAVADDVYALLADNKVEMARHNIRCGVIFFAVGAQAACVEPLIYWDDPEHRLHDRIGETTDLASDLYGKPPPAREVAMRLRGELKALFRRHGCAHVQIARSYPWAQTRDPKALALVESFKDAVDPKRLVNRGALGFGGPR